MKKMLDLIIGLCNIGIDESYKVGKNEKDY